MHKTEAVLPYLAGSFALISLPAEAELSRPQSISLHIHKSFILQTLFWCLCLIQI